MRPASLPSGADLARRGIGIDRVSGETVAAFIAAEADRGAEASTFGRRFAVVRYAHKLAGLVLPRDEAIVSAIRNVTY